MWQKIARKLYGGRTASVKIVKNGIFDEKNDAGISGDNDLSTELLFSGGRARGVRERERARESEKGESQYEQKSLM
ncbi:hypothetical protein EVAR_43412_1 [Eumeta japonica]|uniref:Uncharacterized protein n=1 Tax=Eumeta variegata TaxID=151549 RepID=A0A4C1WUI9_EUMVA|nr:hypothetical protein EVAR_43412_1 [Eumeta japonica]